MSTNQQAIEVAKLVETISGAPDRVGFLRINTKNYKIYDTGILQMAACQRDSHYEYKAERISGGWRVSVRYVGPPASISLPPIYEITVDEKDRLTDIRNVASLRHLPPNKRK